MNTLAEERRFRSFASKGITGARGRLSFHAFPRVASVTKGVCHTCGGPTRRSRYGIMHRDCFGCRYLKMIYGPTIEVTRTDA